MFAYPGLFATFCRKSRPEFFAYSSQPAIMLIILLYDPEKIPRAPFLAQPVLKYFFTEKH